MVNTERRVKRGYSIPNFRQNSGCARFPRSSSRLVPLARWARGMSAGLLGWLMALAAGCVPIGHRHAAAHDQAAAHEWSRYLVGKTAEAEAALVAMRDDEEAKFLLANIALAHGAHDRAASLTAE